MEKSYVVYDGRAWSEPTEDCSILLATSNKREALSLAKENDGVVFAYDVTKDNDMINERQIYN